MTHLAWEIMDKESALVSNKRGRKCLWPAVLEALKKLPVGKAMLVKKGAIKKRYKDTHSFRTSMLKQVKRVVTREVPKGIVLYKK